MNNKSSFSIFAMTLCMMFSYNNCSDFKPYQSEELTLRNSQTLLTKSCLQDKIYSACIFDKSPVNQKQSALKLDDYAAEMTSLQSLGIQFDDKITGQLESQSIVVSSALYPPVQLPSTNIKISISDDSNHVLDQVSAFYWAEVAADKIKDLAGRENIFGDTPILIVVNHEQTGWSHSKKEIYLGYGPTHNFAFDSALIAHLVGEAFIAVETSGEIYNYTSDTQHKACGTEANPLYQQDCCIDKQGCSSAITFGQSDYLASLLFPNQPKLGEYIANNPSGMNICGISRDFGQLSSLTADQAFSACQNLEMAGYVPTLGLLYASIWWEIRKSLDQQELVDFDKLYIEHLKLTNGADNFSSLLEKIKEIDTSMFNSQFTNKFELEFIARGLF